MSATLSDKLKMPVNLKKKAKNMRRTIDLLWKFNHYSSSFKFNKIKSAFFHLQNMLFAAFLYLLFYYIYGNLIITVFIFQPFYENIYNLIIVHT
jgi:hypothetical protein